MEKKKILSERIYNAFCKLVEYTVILKVNPDTKIKNKVEGHAAITLLA